MLMEQTHLAGKTALITGAARRLGAAIATHLHRQGMNIILHYHTSGREAESLQTVLQSRRPESVLLLRADLAQTGQLEDIVIRACQRWGRLDVLINNASSFYPTPLPTATEADWDDLMASNLKAPFFLAQAAAAELRRVKGCIVNMVDIHAYRPRDAHPIYSIAKAGLLMMTKSLAWELRPDVRVNGIAPGAILWSKGEADHLQLQAEILARVPLQRLGTTEDIAQAVTFLIAAGHYINGQVLTIDGGRTVFI